MSFSLKKILKTFLPLIFGALLVWYSLSKISITTLISYFKGANYWWISLGLFFGILSHFSRAYRWKFMLEPMGYKPKFMNSVLAVLVGYLVNLAIPRAGEVSRAAVMTNYEDIPFEKGFGTIVAERIADLIVMFGIIIVTFFIQFDFIYNLLIKNFDPTKIIGIFVGMLLFFWVFTIYIRKATKGIALKIKTFISGLLEGVTSIFKMKKKWAFIFHTLFIWFMYVMMFYVTVFCIEGFSVPTGAVLIGFIAGGFSIAATNGGIGLYPVAVAAAFALFGLPEEQSNAFGWIMWTTQTAMIIIFGGLSFFALPIYNKAK